MIRRTRFQHAHRQRRRPAAGRLLGVAALAALVLPGTVLAGSPNVWEATTYAEYGSNTCGTHVDGTPLVARLDFTRQGGKLTIRVRMDGVPATVSTDYDLSLWNADTCSKIEDVGTVTTDAFGVADVTFSGIHAKSVKTFYAALWSTTETINNVAPSVP